MLLGGAVMKRTALALILISTLLASMVAGTVLFNLAYANFTPLPELPTPIYVKEDGTIEGAEEAIQKTGNTYVFVRNVNKTIEIQKDNIVLDGNGFTLTKPPEINTAGLMTPIGWFPSIRIAGKDNITIRNIMFDKCYTSLSVENSSNILIIQSTMRSGNEGIYMSSGSYCSIIGNEIIDNAHAGLKISDSTFLSIAYNIISRNHGHGGWIAVSYSNISRNDISYNSAPNVGIGLYLYGANSHNYIFENNFINNDIGLVYQGPSVNNTVFNNYWHNHREEIGNAVEDGSDSDQSPLTSPVSTSFDPSLFPPPSVTPTPSPEPQQDAFLTTLVAAASGASATIVGLGVLLYFKKRRK
jgi:parallel beta-helix repeat protein